MMSHASRRRPPAVLQAVVFDLDGTLLDTAEDFVLIAQQMRRNHGLPPISPERIRQTVSGGAAAMVTAAMEHPPEHPAHEDLRQEFLRLYDEILGQGTRPYPGLTELVTCLGEAGIGWGVATNKMRRFAEPLMARMPFNPSAGSLVTPCDVSRAKPDPESILLSCRNLSAEPENTLYIGDHLRDIEAGRAAGCFTIAASYGYLADEDDPAEWHADATAESSESLADMIKRMIA